MLNVVHFQRRRAGHTYSIEAEFEAIRDELARRSDLTVDVVTCRFSNKGLPRWALNSAAAARRQGDVNHITGDVHYLTWALRPNRTVLTVHDCGYEQRLTGLRRSAAGRATLVGPVRRVAAVTAPSSFTRDRIVELAGVAADRVEVVPLCISPVFRRVPGHFNDEFPRILHVGTLPNKNIERLVAALEDLKCTLHVVGRLSSEQRSVLSRSYVHWINTFDLSAAELLNAYASADLVSFASLYEGFGMPILEAQTVGRPVVTSNAASMPETAGGAACLVDPLSVESMRNGIRLVIEDVAYRDELVEKGFENVKRFSASRAADAFAAIYDRVG
ncbi:MAG TPA: glycosyltransferase family 1 protein [Acidimicrobiales bacterium]|nr:glycosyltransferase family 1 protein [Acidimicrobiales bacterium]